MANEVGRFYINSKEQLRVIKALIEADFLLSDAPQSYREINHYDKLGLIKPLRISEKGWRRFMTSDLAWLYVINSLREFGVSLKTIKILFDKLFFDGQVGVQSKEGLRVGPFEFHLSLMIAHKTPVSFILYLDGDFSFVEESKGAMLLKLSRPFISIPLKPIAGDIWSKLTHKYPEYDELNLYALTAKERELILELRSGKFISAEIKFKDGEIALINLVESIEVGRKKLFEILKEHSYQDVKLVTADNQIMTITRTRKRKL